MTGPLREREDAHALLTAEAERARAGGGRLVLLRGATGTGRSAVLEAATAHATHLGLRVLRARCSPDDTALPFSSVLHLLGSVPEFADVGPGDDDRGSAARLWRLLRSYADETPLMVAVDDVHLADEASRRWFVEAARRIDRLPVLLVATERSQYDIDPRPTGLTHALSPSVVRTHTLAPLTDHASAELVRAVFPTASDRWTADCVRAGGGNPLLLHALLDDLDGAPPPTAVPRTCAALYPGSYPAAVSWWLDSAGPATAEVARTLAALEQAERTDRAERPEAAERTEPAERTAPAERTGRPAGAERAEGAEGTTDADARHAARPTPGSPHEALTTTGTGAATATATAISTETADDTAAGAETAAEAATDTLAALVADASGADPARVSGWFTAMTRLGVLRPDRAGRPRYAHPLLRDAVLGGWSTARRQDAHRALAQAMLRRGDHLDAVARQLLGSAPTGLTWALRVLRDAATVAARDARPGDAVRYLRRALREPLPDDLRQRLLTELGSLEYASADTPAGIPRLAEALDLPAEPRDQVRTAIALGTALVGRGRSVRRWRCCAGWSPGWPATPTWRVPCRRRPRCSPTRTRRSAGRPTAGSPTPPNVPRNSSAPPARPCWCGTRRPPATSRRGRRCDGCAPS